MHDRGSSLRALLASMAHQAGDLRLQQAASSLTLLTLLAVVPMAALALAALSALPAFQPLREQFERLLAEQLFLPSISETVVRYVNAFVVAAEQLSALGTVMFLATALTAMLTIDRTLNQIWRTPRPRPLLQRLALYWAMLTLGPVAIGGAVVLQGQVASRFGAGNTLVQASAAVLPSLLSVAVLALLYRLAPSERVRWRDACAGAALGALLLLALKSLLGASLGAFSTVTVVYGTFAALPLFLSWLFAVWLSVLVGALFAANLPSWGVTTVVAGQRTPQAEFDRVVAVLTALLHQAPAHVPSARFRAAFDGDPRVADRVATQLSAQGYLVRTWPAGARGGSAGVWDELWLGTPELPTMTLRPVFDRCWRVGDGLPTQGLDPGGPALTRPLSEVIGAAA